jgi:hypothetical protein
MSSKYLPGLGGGEILRCFGCGKPFLDKFDYLIYYEVDGYYLPYPIVYCPNCRPHCVEGDLKTEVIITDDYYFSDLTGQERFYVWVKAGDQPGNYYPLRRVKKLKIEHKGK